jgi:hypothetical protein
MAIKKIEHKAAKGQKLTLDEVAAFVQDAMQSGASGSEIVGGDFSFGGKLQALSVDVDVPRTDTAPLDKQ